jgi:two-component sensor histidine kinase
MMILKKHKVFFLSILLYITSLPLLAQSRLDENGILHLWDYNADPYSIYHATVWEQLFQKIEIEHTKDDYIKTDIQFALGCIYHDQAKFNKALRLLENVYISDLKSKKIDDKLLLIKLEEEYRAIGSFEKAIKIRKERINKKYINNYWEIYRDCNLYEAAKRDFLTFQKLSPKYTLKRLQQYMLLGDLYFQNNQFDSAKIIFLKGLNESVDFINYNKINKQNINNNLIYFHGVFIGNIATCDLKNGKAKIAIPMLLKDINSSNDNYGNKASKMIYLADALQIEGQIEKAGIFLDSAANILSDKDHKNIDLHLYKAFSNFYSSKGLHKQANEYYKKYYNLNDSIVHKIQSNQSIFLLAHLELNNRRLELQNTNKSLIETQNKVHIKNVTIILLTVLTIISIILTFFLYKTYRNKNKAAKTILRQNQELTEKTAALKNESLKNETLLKEVHHRVKNNLQVISSLLNLQKRRQNNEDTIQMLNSIQNRIQTMALVHENLHRSGDVDSVNASNYIGNLINYLLSTFQAEINPIEIHVDVDKNIELLLEKIILIGLIINEGISNAFKYAFNGIENGEIFIQLKIHNGKYTLIIKDNGKGLESSIQNEKSLGLKLISFISTQLNGTCELINNHGVMHRIKF